MRKLLVVLALFGALAGCGDPQPAPSAPAPAPDLQQLLDGTERDLTAVDG